MYWITNKEIHNVENKSSALHHAGLFMNWITNKKIRNVEKKFSAKVSEQLLLFCIQLIKATISLALSGLATAGFTPVQGCISPRAHVFNPCRSDGVRV